MSTRTDPITHAEHSARHWLAAVGGALGTDDHRHTYRVLRAWLHAVRDRLTVEAAAHFGAQLPVLLRGIYYDGWTPGHVPLRTDIELFAVRFSGEAGIGVSDSRRTCNAVATAMRELFSPGQLDHALALMPRTLRTEFFQRETTGGEPHPEAPRAGNDVAELREDIELLADAISTLAHGLERHPDDEPEDARSTKAARTVHEIMLAREAARQTSTVD